MAQKCGEQKRSPRLSKKRLLSWDKPNTAYKTCIVCVKSQFQTIILQYADFETPPPMRSLLFSQQSLYTYSLVYAFVNIPNSSHFSELQRVTSKLSSSPSILLSFLSNCGMDASSVNKPSYNVWRGSMNGTASLPLSRSPYFAPQTVSTMLSVWRLDCCCCCDCSCCCVIVVVVARVRFHYPCLAKCSTAFPALDGCCVHLCSGE